MDLISRLQGQGHEQIVVGQDPTCGCVGIIAIHDTALGPALGGTRVWACASHDEALTDALRLRGDLLGMPTSPSRVSPVATTTERRSALCATTRTAASWTNFDLTAYIALRPAAA
jgi:hypothetical protein